MIGARVMVARVMAVVLRSCAFVLAAACGGPAAPWQDAPPVALDLKAALSATTVPLLAPFELQLDLFHRRDLEVEFEPKVPSPGFTGSVRAEAPRDLGHGIWRRAVLSLRAVEGPGALTIAPFTARARDGTVAASTPELQLEVTSLLEQAGAEIEPPGPLYASPSRWWIWTLLAAAGALLAFLFVRWRRRAASRPSPAATPVPPHTKALRALARLRVVARTTPAQIEAFYVEVSQVLRTYLEERFGLRAPERTTEEFLAEIEQGSVLATDQRLALQRFLSQCDLVKFAAQLPGEGIHLETFAIAERFVETTRADGGREDERAAEAAAPEPQGAAR
jgi:hypothetical protein